MRDPQKEKRRTMRRQYRSGQRPYVWKLYERLHFKPLYRFPDGSCDWETYFTERETHRNDRCDWVAKKCGGECYTRNDGGGPTKDFRQGYNRQLRTQQRQALREAIRDDILDEFVLPPFRRTVQWAWW